MRSRLLPILGFIVALIAVVVSAPLKAQSPPSATGVISSAAGASGEVDFNGMTGQTTCQVTVLPDPSAGGGFSATLVVEVEGVDLQGWQTVQAYPVGGGVPVSSITTSFVGTVPCTSWTNVRVRAVSFTSGPIDAWIFPTSGSQWGIPQTLNFGGSPVPISLPTGPLTFIIGSPVPTIAANVNQLPQDAPTSAALSLTSTLGTPASMTISRQGVTSIDIASLTGSGATVQFQGQVTASTTFVPISAFGTGGAAASTTAVIDGVYRVNTAGLAKVRVKTTVAGSGSATITFNPTDNSSIVNGYTTVLNSSFNVFRPDVISTGNSVDITGTSCPTNCLTITLGNGQSTIGVDVSSISTAVLTPEVSNDNTLWRPTSAYAQSGGGTATTIAANGGYAINVAGWNFARLRTSTTGTGHVIISYDASVGLALLHTTIEGTPTVNAAQSGTWSENQTTSNPGFTKILDTAGANVAKVDNTNALRTGIWQGTVQAGVDSSNRLQVVQSPSSPGFTRNLNATVVAICASCAWFGSLVTNNQGAITWIQVFNVASGSVTLGTTEVTAEIFCAANAVCFVPVPPTIGVGLSAWSWAATTTEKGSTGSANGVLGTAFHS